MMRKFKWDETVGIIFFAISIVMLIISVYLCFSDDIWYDELFTMGFVSNGIGELISWTARDVHPPLYYIIVFCFVKMAGESPAGSIFAAKFASVVPFFLCAFLSVTKVRKYYGFFTAGLFSFLVVSMPQLSACTVEVRMYGYALLFVVAGMLYAYEIVTAGGQKKATVSENGDLRCWIGLSVCAIAACYTHYFACVAAVMIYLYLGVCFCLKVRKRENNIKIFRNWLLSGITCSMCYLPWLIRVVTVQVKKVQESYWIAPVSLRTLGGCVEYALKPAFANELFNVVMAVFLFGVYALLVGNAFINRAKENKEQVSFALGCIHVLLGIIIFGMIASVLIKPVFIYRYMLPALGVFWLAFSILLNEWKHNKIVLIGLLIVLGITGVRNFRAFYGNEMWKKLQMEQAKQVLSQIEKEDILLYNFDQAQAVVSFYLNNESYLWYGQPEELIQEMYPQNHALVEEFSDEEGIKKIKELLKTGKRVFFWGSGNARDEIRQKWEQKGIFTKEKASIMMERYWLNLYQLSDEASECSD